ncbi:hypothetical protein PHYC_02076 [Phycisphaerales bacterium]|nr:hypothetical protein PHYC_02076 [Phycisphaerales bacterium]
MANTYSKLYTHIVFSTKHREPWLGADVRPKVWAYMSGIVENKDCTLVLANGWVDHAHLLVIRKPKVSESDLVGPVKSNSSRWIREQWPGMRRFAWQDGFAAFSVSHSKVDDVRRYIQNQESHHGRVSYESEFLGLLKKHGVEYDRRYVFDDGAVIAG